MELSEELREFGRWMLAGALGLILLIGLVWAMNPDESGGVTYRAEEPAAEESPPPVGEDPPEELDPEAEAAPAPTPTAEPTPTGPPPEELIAAAREPEQTSVQVLDAGGGGQRARQAADALSELGYNVVNVTSARARPDATTVWFNDGNEDEALALRARDDRFTEVEPNQGLSTGVDLHVLVAADF